MRAAISCIIALGAVVFALPEDTISDGITPYWYKPLVTSLGLQSRVKSDALLGHAKALQAIAYNTTGRNRLMGSPGHEGTVDYLYKQLTHPSLGGYYNVTLQPWSGVVQKSGTGSLFVNGKNTSITIGGYSPSGTFRAPLSLAGNLGCNETDYPKMITGNIALISRGTCTFAEKSGLAGKMGAVGAIIFNNAAVDIPGLTLEQNGTTKFGPVIPTVGISGTEGNALAALIKSGVAVTAAMTVKTVIQNVTTNNVLAQTRYGDPSSVLVIGAHSDSVEAGPGVNDDGSGLSSILEIAKLLASYRVRNSVRFGWWSGEESGKLGSTYYVTHLSKAEQKKIKLYLNFDMMASPNYQYGIFDGDGGDFNTTAPMGSGDIEKLFIEYFAARDLNYTTIALNGRSDYAPFQDAGIPVGGLATGAEANKTKAGVEEFGGWEGKPFDQNYHAAGDTVANLNMTAFLVNTQGIGHAVATYARSFSGVGFNETVEEEGAEKRKRDVVRRAMTSLEKKKGNKLGASRKKWQSRRENQRVYL